MPPTYTTLIPVLESQMFTAVPGNVRTLTGATFQSKLISLLSPPPWSLCLHPVVCSLHIVGLPFKSKPPPNSVLLLPGTGSHIALSGLELFMQPRMTLPSLFFCLHFPSAGILGVCHHCLACLAFLKTLDSRDLTQVPVLCVTSVLPVALSLQL